MLRKHPLYTAAQVRQLDRRAIEQVGIPGYTLMSRAGKAAWDLLRNCWPDARSLLILCGTGNNGGDGYVIGRLALSAGHAVQVMQLGDVDRIKGDALTAREAYLAAGGRSSPVPSMASMTSSTCPGIRAANGSTFPPAAR